MVSHPFHDPDQMIYDQTQEDVVGPLPIAANQQTWDVQPMLVQCWASVVDDGLALQQQWLMVSCLLG